MNTPIYDFAKTYRDLRPARFHMPGHKGRGPLGCEDLDLTEIPGADSLYEAAGIIAESEANASRLFGCPTFYSTEGSSHCIRAMLLLAMQYACRDKHCLSASSDEATWDGEKRIATASVRTGLAMTDTKRFRVLAARNAHRAFLTAAALLDLDVRWLPADDSSYLSAAVTPEALDAALAETGAEAVYLSCPNYLGFLPDLRPLAAVCHARGALLLVDNAHGAYLRFLTPSRHPMDLGADLCCDSAHKTLPVLTGGAYLHVAERLGMQNAKCKMQNEAIGNRQQVIGDGGCGLPRQFANWLAMTGSGGGSAVGAASGRQPEAITSQTVRDALALFGSTSPSYLILQSLDLANPYLETLPERLAAFLPKVEALKERLRAAGWRLVGDEPLKLTLDLRSASEAHVGTSIACPLSGADLSASLEREGIFCEFADPDFAVFMLSPQNTEEELERLEAALAAVGSDALIAPVIASGNDAAAKRRQEASGDASLRGCAEFSWAEHREPSPVSETVCSIREAMLAPAETVAASESLGRVLARPGVSCPPAVPILMPGERITETDIAAFERYGIETVCVLFCH